MMLLRLLYASLKAFFQVNISKKLFLFTKTVMSKKDKRKAFYFSNKKFVLGCFLHHQERKPI